MTSLTHLQRLEADSIQIFREAVSESEKPVMLYSVGKDSAVMLHLAVTNFTGIDSPYEAPEDPDIRLNATGTVSAEVCATEVVTHLRDAGVLLPPSARRHDSNEG